MQNNKTLERTKWIVRTLLLLKFISFEVVEWIAVVFLKRFISIPIYQSINLPIFGVISIINVAILISILQRSSWYKYAYDVEKKKDKSFANPIMEKTYNALVLDYKWLFYKVTFIYLLNTLFLSFYIL